MGVKVRQDLERIFGQGEVGDKVRDFDFSSISVSDKDSDDFLYLGLAPSYRSLNRESVTELNDETKIMMAGALQALAKIESHVRNAQMVEGTMVNNPMLAPFVGEDVVFRSDRFIKNSSSDFSTDGSSDSAIVEEVHDWFSNLIDDSDALDSTQIDSDILEKVVAQTGAMIDSFVSDFAQDEYHEKTMIDIEVLQFPDNDHPYFKLFHVQLKAFSDSSEGENGMAGEYRCRRFKPHSEVVGRLRGRPRDHAIDMADNLFE